MVIEIRKPLETKLDPDLIIKLIGLLLSDRNGIYEAKTCNYHRLEFVFSKLYILSYLYEEASGIHIKGLNRWKFRSMKLRTAIKIIRNTQKNIHAPNLGKARKEGKLIFLDMFLEKFEATLGNRFNNTLIDGATLLEWNHGVPFFLNVGEINDLSDEEKTLLRYRDSL